MRYVWKFLSLISGLVLCLFAFPTALIARVHMWLCRKGNPELDAMASFLNNVNKKDPKEMGEAIAEMMKAMHPELVAEAKVAADAAVDRHTRPFAWGREPTGLPVINPVIPRVPGIPPVPAGVPAAPGHCCSK